MKTFLKFIDTLSEQHLFENITEEQILEAIEIICPEESVSLGQDSLFESIFDQFLVEAYDRYEEINEKVKYVQPWAKETEGLNPTETYYVALKYAQEAENEFRRGLNKAAAGRHPKVLVALKSHDSFIDKTFLRKKNSATVDDVLRGAILCDNGESVDQTILNLKKIFKVVDHDYKAKGDDESYGYFGSHHISAVTSNGVACELQVMTRRLWTAKKPAHKVYNAHRTEIEGQVVDQAAKERDLEYSRKLFRWGNGEAIKL